MGVYLQLETRWQGRKPCSTDEKRLCMTDESWVHGRLQRDFRGAARYGSGDEATQVGGRDE